MWVQGSGWLFRGLDLNIAPRDRLALIGRNGAGKTSLLRAIAGLASLEAGAITFGALAAEDARAEHIHLAGHQDGQKPARTAWEELSFWARWNGASYDAARRAAWVRLARTPRAERRLALVLSDYPGPGGGIGHAVGLDSPASVCAMLNRLAAEGYAFLTELVRRLIGQGYGVIETPIVFADRRSGQSKMSGRIIAESMLLVTRWGVRDLVGGRTRARRRPSR